MTEPARSGWKLNNAYGLSLALSPTLFRNAGKSAIAAGADARVSIDARPPRSRRAQYRVSRDGPGASDPYRDGHADHSDRGVHSARKRPPDASTTKTPGTRQ